MKTLRYKITGVAPLLMHSVQTANPLNRFTKKLKEITGKRNKTDEDHQMIAEIEFEAGLYYKESIGYYIPAENIDATLFASAKHFKLGTTWKQGALVIEDCPLIFKHNNLSPADLFGLPAYVDMRIVKIQTSKNIRCRPIFHEWEFEMDLYIDEAKLNDADVDQIVTNAGKYIGLCDYRPRFGRFEAVKL